MQVTALPRSHSQRLQADLEVPLLSAHMAARPTMTHNIIGTAATNIGPSPCKTQIHHYAKILLSVMPAGPTRTIITAGKINATMGTMSLTAIFSARSSARWLRTCRMDAANV